MSEKQKGGGISFMGLLAIVFITLKLCHVIAWSWWFVLLPIYFPIMLYVLLVLFIFFIDAYLGDK